MTDGNPFQNALFKGLRALAESSFPKRCANCGRTFQTAEQFLSETRDISTSRSGLKEADDDKGNKIVEAFRNCPCGSSLMDFFSDRRDFSETGVRRRKEFGELLDFLEKQNVERSLARTELLKFMRGEHSELLTRFLRGDGNPAGEKTG